jgi:UDP:flavonoid glycosyltransferase YjiC (YdhE family)
MALVAYYVHGRGRGHATRALTIVPALRAAGHDVVLHSGADALEVLHPTERPVDVGVVPRGPLAPFHIATRAFAARGGMSTLRPDVVVSDGDAPSMHAARSLGIPCVVVGHGLVFGHVVLPAGLPRTRVVLERINVASSSWLADRRVAVHFLPARAKTRGTVVARPDPRPDLPPASTGAHATVYLRDGLDLRGHAVLDALGRAYDGEVLAFLRLDERASAATRALPPNVTLCPTDPTRFAAALATARLVVGSAGSNLLAECVWLRKPMVAVFAPGDHEQHLNATLLAKAGAGVSLPSATADEATMRAALDVCLALPPLAAGLETMPTVSSAITDVVRELTSR